MKLVCMDGKVWVEAVPGMLSLVATQPAWDALSADGKLHVLRAAYEHLGLPFEPSID